MSHQLIVIVGQLSKKPEMEFLPNGTPLTKFSVPTNKTYKKNGEPVTETVWHNVAVFAKNAEACYEYLDKGSLVYIEGSATPHAWIDKNGEAKCSLDVNAHKVQFLGDRKKKDEVDEDSPEFMQD